MNVSVGFVDNGQGSADSVHTAGDDATRPARALARQIEIGEALTASVRLPDCLERRGGLAFQAEDDAGIKTWQVFC